MLQGVGEFIQQRPIATGAMVIGVGALALFAFGNGGGEQSTAVSEYGSDYFVGAMDPSVIAANNALYIAQQESADRRYALQIDAQLRAGEAALNHEQVRWSVDAADARDERDYLENINLASTQLAVVREQEASNRAIAQIEGTTRSNIAQVEGQIATQQSRDARRGNRDNVIGSVISSAAMLAAFAFGF